MCHYFCFPASFISPQLSKQIVTQTNCLLLEIKEKNTSSDAPNTIAVTPKHPKTNIPIWPNYPRKPLK